MKELDKNSRSTALTTRITNWALKAGGSKMATASACCAVSIFLISVTGFVPAALVLWFHAPLIALFLLGVGLIALRTILAFFFDK